MHCVLDVVLRKFRPCLCNHVGLDNSVVTTTTATEVEYELVISLNLLLFIIKPRCYHFTALFFSDAKLTLTNESFLLHWIALGQSQTSVVSSNAINEKSACFVLLFSYVH